MNYPRCYTVLLGVLSASMLAPQLTAQSDYGSVVGFVRDASGGVISKTKVVIRNEATGQENPHHHQRFGSLCRRQSAAGLLHAPGRSFHSFKRFESLHNKLDSNSTLSLDVTLTIGAVNETVEVVASAEPLADRVCRRRKDGDPLANRRPGAEWP